MFQPSHLIDCAYHFGFRVILTSIPIFFLFWVYTQNSIPF